VRRLAFALLWGVVFYLAGATAGCMGVHFFSSNRHDRDVEAAMTSAFFYGPVAGAIGLVFGAIRGGRKPRANDRDPGASA